MLEFPLDHNGGPLLIDRHPDDHMRFYQLDIDDWLDTIQKARLKPNVIGIYSVVLTLIYKHMGALRDDDAHAAGHCNCDVRTYRDVKKLLVGQGRLYVVEGYIYNDRAMAEIAKFCATAARKRAASLAREEAKRATVVDTTSARIAQGLQQGLHNLCAKFAEVDSKICYIKSEKTNKNNDCVITAVVDNEHGCGSALPQIEIEIEREEREEISHSPPSPPGPPRLGRKEALEAFTAYNETALKCGLPQASRMSPDRERKIIARLKEFGVDGWTQALANISRSSFLCGHNDRNWRASLDFMLQATSFAKLHDGGYGNGRHATRGNGTGLEAARERADVIDAWAEARRMTEADDV